MGRDATSRHAIVLAAVNQDVWARGLGGRHSNTSERENPRCAPTPPEPYTLYLAGVAFQGNSRYTA